MSTAPPSPSVLVIGRSAAQRSAIAGTFRRAGMSATEIDRAASVSPHSLEHVRVVVALDQHDFVVRLLCDAQERGIQPLLLPVGAAATLPLGVGASESLHAHTPQSLREKHAVDDADDADDRIVLHPVGVPHDTDKPAAVPPQLDTALPAGTRWFVALAFLIGIAAAAYLTLAPPTEEERAQTLEEHRADASQKAWGVAADVAWHARDVARYRPVYQETLPVACERLLAEGRSALAATVCGRAYAQRADLAGSYAQALLGRGATRRARAIIAQRLEDDPQDADAWRVLATLARRSGDADTEREALEHLITILDHRDPAASLRERLQRLTP